MTHRLATVLALLALGFAGCKRPTSPKPLVSLTPGPTPTPVKTPTPAPTPEPTPTPTPTPYVPQKTLNIGSIFNGINFKARLETITGTTASADRDLPGTYTVEVNVKVNVPKPHQSLDELRKLNGKIDTVLPGLPMLLESAKISPVFDDLYRRKVTSIRTNLDRLDQIISRHNFYDCETVLDLQEPATKRRLLLVQADMDVDTDGTDGDRVPTVELGSRTFQPFTSYRWKKRTPTPNPCMPIWEKRITDNEAKARDAKTSAADVQRLKNDSARLRMELRDLQVHSFLVGATDPFIVLPSQMFSGGKNGFEPRIGDYCVVLVGEVLYPAIIGDAGPTAKIGEASLRLCRQVSARANGENRPMNDLKATYLIFPNSGDKDWGPPDLKHWHARCDELMKEIGDYTGTLFEWEDLTKPVTPPSPAPAPAPAPAPPPAPPPAPVQQPSKNSKAAGDG
jgi:hypothetical protein